jgi:hypothetical protein
VVWWHAAKTVAGSRGAAAMMRDAYAYCFFEKHNPDCLALKVFFGKRPNQEVICFCLTSIKKL